MTLSRILEPEWMDSPEEADAYDAMDHHDVNRRFVADLIEAVEPLRVPETTGGADMENHDSAWFETPQLDVLDLGTGTALIPIELCRQVAHCRVMAVDAARAMLELARYRVEAASLLERIQLGLADAKQLPHESEQFHIVISNSLVHHLPRPIEALGEAVRVTAPGGWLFIRDLCRPADENELARLVEMYASDEPEIARRLFADSLRAALTVEEMGQLVEQLDFPPASVQATSDRHWTWVAQLPPRRSKEAR
jgi:ubiquinone/menaquinone biosynthesis C-methylase UbiE